MSDNVHISDLLNKLNTLKSASCLDEISELDIVCKTIIKRFFDSKHVLDKKTLVRVQAVLDYMYEKINIGHWKDVHKYLRKTMTIASYIKLLVFLQTSDTSQPISKSILKEIFKIIDYGLLFGCPFDCQPNLLHECAAFVNNTNIELYAEFGDAKIENKDIISSQGTNSNCIAIETIDCPSMEDFYNNYIMKEKPVILANCINHWPALTKWKDHKYLLKLAGLRTVPIELGSNYTDQDWTQKLMTLEEFIKEHIYNSTGTIGYLAQYQLFEQIPELKDDIVEPEYCYFSDTEEPINIHAWYGPKGTVSPLHHDPKKNLLTQVIGEKQIYLFSPADSEFLYPHEAELLNNTARVDPRNPNFELYPKYRDVKAYYCILRPGQMLYIPPKWWHFIESLSVSFSVSFWWN